MTLKDHIDYVRWRIAAWIMPHWMLTIISQAVRETSRNIEVRF